jgi:hypothetical protein
MTACGQTNVSDRINEKIENSKTNKHVNISGTRLYIVPPKGFVVANTFIGLQKGQNSMINIYDLVGGNFYSNAKTFSKDAFESKGVRVFEYKEINVNGYPAKYIFMQGDATSKAYVLVFGDTTFSTMLMAVYPVTDEQTGKDILNSFNTICYDTKKVINPFETANFTLDDNGSKFKFNRYTSNMYIYSIGGKESEELKDTPIFLVFQIPKNNSMTSKSIAEMMLGKIQQYGLTNPVIKNASSEKINGYETYQMEVSGQAKDKSASIYYCVVANGDKAIVMQGIIPDSNTDYLQAFKKLAWTIKLK